MAQQVGYAINKTQILEEELGLTSEFVALPSCVDKERKDIDDTGAGHHLADFDDTGSYTQLKLPTKKIV